MKNLTLQEFLAELLPVKSPWHISNLEIDDHNQRADIMIDYYKGSQFPCQQCGRLCKVHDGHYHQWRYMDFFEYKCYLQVKIPRTKCPEHGVKVIEKTPWGRMGSHYSFSFEKVIMRFSAEMSMSAVSRELDEPDSNLWRVFRYYVDKAVAQQLDLKEVKRINVDETAHKRGHSYISVFSDMNTGNVIYVADGRKQEVFGELYGWLIDKNSHPDNIELFGMDMSKSYIAGQKAYFINSDLSFDKFHVKMALNKAVDTVRRQEVIECEQLKGTKYMWLKQEANLTEKEKQTLSQFLIEGTTKTAIGYQLKIAFDKIWQVQPKAAVHALDSWLDIAWQSGLKPIMKFVETVDNHFKGIVTAIITKTNNAKAEGLNSIIQLARSRARGFRNIQNFKAMVYFLGNNFKLSFH